MKFLSSSLVKFSKSPISKTFSINPNSNSIAAVAASLMSASSFGVLNSGCSFINVLNNQHPASECSDSSLTDHSTIWPIPFSLFLILNESNTAKELNKLTPSVNAEKIARETALLCQSGLS